MCQEDGDRLYPTLSGKYDYFYFSYGEVVVQ